MLVLLLPSFGPFHLNRSRFLTCVVILSCARLRTVKTLPTLLSITDRDEITKIHDDWKELITLHEGLVVKF